MTTFRRVLLLPCLAALILVGCDTAVTSTDSTEPVARSEERFHTGVIGFSVESESPCTDLVLAAGGTGDGELLMEICGGDLPGTGTSNPISEDVTITHLLTGDTITGTSQTSACFKAWNLIVGNLNDPPGGTCDNYVDGRLDYDGVYEIIVGEGAGDDDNLQDVLLAAWDLSLSAPDVKVVWHGGEFVAAKGNSVDNSAWVYLPGDAFDHNFSTYTAIYLGGEETNLKEHGRSVGGDPVDYTPLTSNLGGSAPSGTSGVIEVAALGDDIYDWRESTYSLWVSTEPYATGNQLTVGSTTYTLSFVSGIDTPSTVPEIEVAVYGTLSGSTITVQGWRYDN